MATGKSRNLAFISRQRIVGRTNGSSTYALSILSALRVAGCRIHYICPSPHYFGSWPFVRLSDELLDFDSIRVRGSIRVGRYLLAGDPKVAMRALGLILQRLALKVGIIRQPIIGKAPYAIASPLTEPDRRFLAHYLPAISDSMLFDYAFLIEARSYAGHSEAPNAVLMHDLFSSRRHQFQVLASHDSVADMDFETEIAMLSGADRIVAIQQVEARTVEARVGPGRVIIAPMAVSAVAAHAPGEQDLLLFVGSNTAPNVDGIRWFLAEVWPLARTRRPNLHLDVVGTVCGELHGTHAGVQLHGLVTDLTGYYRRAGVVISPLRAGSGLKIKFVEALAHGKACVVTSTTCQGIETQITGAAMVTDSAAAQAEAIAQLFDSPASRNELASKALHVAQRHFGIDACYSALIDYLCNPESTTKSTPESSTSAVCSLELRPADRMQKQATMEPTRSTSPEVSVIIAAYNVAPYIERAVRSALAQADVSIEVIVVDDGSTDNTVEVVERIAAAEVRTLRLGANSGPGAARNAAIEAARGDWIAVLDGDDAFLPGRLARCLRSARSANAQVLVDDLLVVDEDGTNPRPMFDWQNRASLDALTPETFITGNSNFLSGHSLGYVKPLVERRFIVERGVRYPTELSIGEDYLFLLELLVRGATCHVDPTPGYAYTARVGSTSHRLTRADVARIQHGDAEFMKRHRLDPAAMAAQHRREANLLEALDYKELVEQIKQGKLLAALVSSVTRPLAARHLWLPVKKRLARFK